MRLRDLTPTPRNSCATPSGHAQRIRHAALELHPALFVVAGPEQGGVFPLSGPEMLIGRSPGVAVQFTDPGIALLHARLVVDGNDVWLEDLVEAGGQRRPDSVPVPMRLDDGDYLRLGDQTVVKFALMSTLEERTLRELRESALRDPLTRLYNRRYLDERLRSEFSFAQRHRSPLSVLLIDIDHFKSVNDRFGHQAGDLILRVVAKALRRLTRPEDVVARFGGEEFVVVGRGLSLRNAMILSERIRRCVADLRVPLAEPPVTVTVSIGVATMEGEPAPSSVDDLIATADQAMYAAKAAGRNRVRPQGASQLGADRESSLGDT